MTVIELRERMVTMLVQMGSGSRGRWRQAIGTVRVYPRDTHAHCNWEVFPSGTAQENGQINRTVDALRDEHPFVTAS